MKSFCILTLGAVLAAGAAFAQETAPKGRDAVADKRPPAKIESFKPEEQTSEGSVTVVGSRIDYQAIAGTLVVHPKGWDDAARAAEKGSGREDQQNTNRPDGASSNQNPTAEAAMFYVAYFKKGAAPEARPVTSLFNGGPGSSTGYGATRRCAG
jgi:carboxypeptidase C (cathepsin A)